MANQNAPKDDNDVSALLVTSAVDGTTMRVLGDPVTGAMYVITAGSLTDITIGTTTVTGGTNKGILYDNAGVVGEYIPSASLILATDASKNVVGLATATYPSLTELSYVKGVTSAIQTQLNAKGAGTVTTVSVASANGFSGTVANATTTPAITIIAGAITPTSVNGLTISTSTGTLTVVNGKVLTVNKSLTLEGTDSTTMTFPSTTASIARTDAAQTFTGTQTFSQVITTANTVTVASNAGTVPVTSKTNNFTNSSASAMTITMATTSAVDGQQSIVRIYDFTAATKGITWVNTENSANVTAPANSVGSTTIPLTVGFIFNGSTSKWTCVSFS